MIGPIQQPGHGVQWVYRIEWYDRSCAQWEPYAGVRPFDTEEMANRWAWRHIVASGLCWKTKFRVQLVKYNV